MSNCVVSVAYEGGIAVVAVSNPPVNTIDAKVREGLSQAVSELEARKDIKAAVLLCEGKSIAAWEREQAMAARLDAAFR